MRPIETRFGLRAPRREKALAALSNLWDETIVANGGDAAAHSGDADHRFRQADRRFQAMPITLEERKSIGARGVGGEG